MSPGRKNDDVMFGTDSQDALSKEDGFHRNAMLREKVRNNFFNCFIFRTKYF